MSHVSLFEQNEGRLNPKYEGVDIMDLLVLQQKARRYAYGPRYISFEDPRYIAFASLNIEVGTRVCLAEKADEGDTRPFLEWYREKYPS